MRAQSSRTVGAGRTHLRRLLNLSNALRNSGKPTIAKVDGYAIGGGHELHLMCDLTIASSRSTFGQVGPRVGSVPVWGGTQLLTRMVGEKRAREMIFLCHKYTADEALAMGLINRVVAPEDLDAEVDRWCQELLDKSPEALRIAKIALNFESDLLAPAYTHASEMLALTYGTEENMEGVTAFLEKRPPNYRNFEESVTRAHPGLSQRSHRSRDHRASVSRERGNAPRRRSRRPRSSRACTMRMRSRRRSSCATRSAVPRALPWYRSREIIRGDPAQSARDEREQRRPRHR